MNHSEQTEKIKKLIGMVAQFQGALKAVDDKTGRYQNSSNRLQCPRALDFQRFQSLTNEPIKKPLYEFVILNYEKTITEVEDKIIEEYFLKENIDTEVLDKMSEIFKALGYFNMDNILKGKASGMLKGVFG